MWPHSTWDWLGSQQGWEAALVLELKALPEAQLQGTPASHGSLGPLLPSLPEKCTEATGGIKAASSTGTCWA